MNFDKSVKEIHEIASGVPPATLTANRPCHTSHNRYFCRANCTTARQTLSLCYLKWENAVTGLSCPQVKHLVSPCAVISMKKRFWWWCHYVLIWLLLLRLALGPLLLHPVIQYTKHVLTKQCTYRWSFCRWCNLSSTKQRKECKEYLQRLLSKSNNDGNVSNTPFLGIIPSKHSTNWWKAAELVCISMGDSVGFK